MTAVQCAPQLRKNFSTFFSSAYLSLNRSAIFQKTVNERKANLCNIAKSRIVLYQSNSCFFSSLASFSLSAFNYKHRNYHTASPHSGTLFCSPPNTDVSVLNAKRIHTNWCNFNYQAKRTYLHFGRTHPEDYELPMDTMPENINELMAKDPKNLDFFENYWYWRIRGEATVLDAENLPKKSYKQLARDMGMQVMNEQTEHMVGLLELYEYLKSSPFVGPFGTVENPVLVPSVHTERIVACTGGTGDSEHVPLWFRCREGFLYRCGECDQIFMLVKVLYSLPDGVDPFPVDPDIDDVFNYKLIEKGQKEWNSGEYVHWPVGNATYKQLFLEGKWGNEVPKYLIARENNLTE